MTNKDMTQVMKQMMNMMEQMSARMDALEQASQKSTTSKVSAKKSSSAKKSTTSRGSQKLVDFTKHNGEVIKCTEAQAKAWNNYRNREHLTLDEVKAISFNGKFTKAMDKWLIANPTCTCKDFKAQFSDARGCTKDQLKTHKAQLRAEGKMR